MQLSPAGAGCLALAGPPTGCPVCPGWPRPTLPVQVALQRKMFEEYERRELRRKVAELQEVCPDCSTQEAEKALELCDGRWASGRVGCQVVCCEGEAMGRFLCRIGQWGPSSGI